jgi:putative cell wall-binding protein
VIRPALLVAILATLILSGCSLKSDSSDTAGGGAIGVQANEDKAADKLGFPIVATKNTTRVAGQDPAADAAGVASALFPAGSAASRPPAVLLVEQDDWQGAIAAGALVGSPVRAPILLSDGDSLPTVTEETLKRLKPRGSNLTKGAQVVLIGDDPPPPDGVKSTALRGGDPYVRAAAIDRYSSAARGKPTRDVVVTSGEKPEFAMPAAAWAARSGDSVLFVKADSIPGPTKTALARHEKPNIFILGPVGAVGTGVEKQLRALGKVRRIAGPTAPENSIAFAGYTRGGFGWGPIAPGRNYTVANSSRPGDAAAAAGLGANGIFAPLLLTDNAERLPRQLEAFFLDVQPGYEGGDPSNAVYNHVWLLGDAKAVSPAAQARIDEATELVPVDAAPR